MIWENSVSFIAHFQIWGSREFLCLVSAGANHRAERCNTHKARFKLGTSAGIYVAIVGQDPIDSYQSIPWRNPQTNQMDHVFARYDLEDHATWITQGLTNTEPTRIAWATTSWMRQVDASGVSNKASRSLNNSSIMCIHIMYIYINKGWDTSIQSKLTPFGDTLP